MIHIDIYIIFASEKYFINEEQGNEFLVWSLMVKICTHNFSDFFCLWSEIANELTYIWRYLKMTVLL